MLTDSVGPPSALIEVIVIQIRYGRESAAHQTDSIILVYMDN